MTFIIITLVFFAVFAILSAILEERTVQSNLRTFNTKPLDHGKLLERRLFVGALFFAGLLLVSLFQWRLLWLIPAAAAIFAGLHRLTFNQAGNKGPFYLGVDNRYDLFWLGLLRAKTHGASGDHFFCYLNKPKYRRPVVLAAFVAYLFELLTLITFTLIATP